MFDDNLFLNGSRSTIEISSLLFSPEVFNTLSASDKLFLWRRNRAVTLWNQRTALLKAVDNGLDGTDLSDAEGWIEGIDNWFRNQRYNSNIDAATGQAVTPLIDAARLKTFAKQNNRATQDIAATALATDLFRIGTDLANIVSQNVGGPVGSG